MELATKKYDLHKALFDEKNATAIKKTNGVWSFYISTTRGILRFSGPPLQAAEIDLNTNSTCFRPFNPKLDFNNIRQCRIDIKKFLKENTPFDDHFLLLKTSLENLTLFRDEIIGKDLFRRICRFGSRHYELAFLSSKLPREYGDLLVNNPSIAFVFSTIPYMITDDVVTTARKILRLKQKDLCDFLKLPASSWKILRKIQPQALNEMSLRLLAKAVESAHIRKAVRHLPTIGLNSLAILGSNLIHCVSDRFLLELSRLEVEGCEEHIGEMLRTTLECMHELNIGFQQRIMFESIKQLDERYNQLFGHLSESDYWLIRNVTFHPPVSDEPGLIEFIPDAKQLISEGISQNNCIAGSERCRSIQQGKVAVYRCQGWGLHRATIQLEPEKREGQTVWVATEVCGYNNQPVNRQTLESIGLWLGENQGISDFNSLVYGLDHTPHTQTQIQLQFDGL